jgi:hypothetical protein
MVGAAIEKAVSFVVWVIIVLFVFAVLGGISLVGSLTRNNKTIETQTKPTITWELKARGQKIDTIWIYKFK